MAALNLRINSVSVRYSDGSVDDVTVGVNTNFRLLPESIKGIADDLSKDGLSRGTGPVKVEAFQAVICD